MTKIHLILHNSHKENEQLVLIGNSLKLLSNRLSKATDCPYLKLVKHFGMFWSNTYSIFH